MMKTVILICLLVISMSTRLSGQERIRLTNGEWPPYLSQTLKHSGLASRIVTEAFALEGIQVTYRFFPWKRAYKLAATGQWDGSVIWQPTPEREQAFYFSETVLAGTYVFFHLKSYPFDWHTIEDLTDLTIGATGGYTYGGPFDQAVQAKTLNVEYVPKDVQNLKKLLIGRIHIFPVEREVGYDLLQRHFKPDEVALVTHHAKPLKTTDYHLILAKKVANNQRMLALFNKGLKRLYQSGKVDQFVAESNRGDYRNR